MYPVKIGFFVAISLTTTQWDLFSLSVCTTIYVFSINYPLSLFTFIAFFWNRVSHSELYSYVPVLFVGSTVYFWSAYSYLLSYSSSPSSSWDLVIAKTGTDAYFLIGGTPALANPSKLFETENISLVFVGSFSLLSDDFLLKILFFEKIPSPFEALLFVKIPMPLLKKFVPAPDREKLNIFFFYYYFFSAVVVFYVVGFGTSSDFYIFCSFYSFYLFYWAGL